MYEVYHKLQSTEESLSAGDTERSVSDKSLIQEIRPGVLLETLEPRSEKKHTHIRGSLPDGYPIESSFSSGPVLAVFASNSTIDVANGLTLWKGQPIRETAVVSKLIDSYDAPSSKTARGAMQWSPERVMLPLASQRMANYCRWWIDSAAKVYIARTSHLYRSAGLSRPIEAVFPSRQNTFQRQTIEVLKPFVSIVSTEERFVRGASINSPGLTYGGGQRLGALVRGFSNFLNQVTSNLATSSSKDERLYITRNETPMRRIVNEDELLPALKALGFRTILPANLTMREQISAFRNAKIIVSAHGAALTNILFCRPGTVLVEIFPEGGVHGSMFLRMGSHLNLEYFFVVGECIPNAQSTRNPNNSDIRVNRNSFVSFVKHLLG